MSVIEKIRGLRASIAAGQMSKEEAVAALTEDGGFTELGAKDVLNTPDDLNERMYGAAFRGDNSEYQRLRMAKKSLRRGMDS